MIIKAKGEKLDGYYLLNGKTVHDLNSAIIREMKLNYDYNITLHYVDAKALYITDVCAHDDGHYEGSIARYTDFKNKIVDEKFANTNWWTDCVNPSVKDAYKAFYQAIIRRNDAIMDSFIG